jgi:hypothetical protein
MRVPGTPGTQVTRAAPGCWWARLPGTLPWLAAVGVVGLMLAVGWPHRGAGDTKGGRPPGSLELHLPPPPDSPVLAAELARDCRPDAMAAAVVASRVYRVSRQPWAQAAIAEELYLLRCMLLGRRGTHGHGR